MSFYLYGLLNTPHYNLSAVGPLFGLDKQPVHLQTLGDFSALYSEAKQERYLASRLNLLAHETVLEKVMAEGHPNLLPLQFGVVVTDWEQVHRNLIGAHDEELQKLFRQLDGHREVSVKLFWEQETELQRLLAENPLLKDKRDALAGSALSMDSVIAIGKELEDTLEQRRQSVINTFKSALCPLACDPIQGYVEGNLLTDNMAYNAAFLIPWDKESAFAQQVEELDKQFEGRLRIRYNNFTAPYNFARFEVE
ncbi:GvpL/GvpF family gas vesicle protein [Leptolyngbya sp. FACHB-261]|uniref:GvpL/GvpF family gas vesicle protein n=1 Tax=Leptolyngbya sp. FACHB-261 TaxID=2692806 RepID=UPI001688C210|nr:GvpL/GvpF family gas vesicle protein [Leptolyngbya sp. FACHB-261]MBD2104064.1 GvpL/GvpF family gas vesicle protein [Leptolyngbya sp. FACHB-261]